MNPFEYIDFEKDDFIANCIKDNGFSESDAKEIHNTIRDYIRRFKEVRSSESLSGAIVKELLDKCKSRIGPGSGDESDKYIFLTHWITKSLWQDKTFYWAKIRLGQYYNRESGYTEFDIDKEIMSLGELYELLKDEKDPKSNSKQFKADNLFLIELCRVCVANKILECTEVQFLISTTTGDFSNINFTNKTRGQYLVYQMKTIMGNDWYENAVKSNGWTKDDCNKFGKNFHETNGWADKVHQLIANYHKPQ